VTPGRRWDYRNPVKVVFGVGTLDELGVYAQGRSLVVTSAGMTSRGVTARVTDLLERDGSLLYDHVQPNPTLAQVDQAILMLRGERIDSIVAVGGGSSLDVGKVLSLALRAPDFALADLVAGDHPWSATEPLPLTAVPTTAGTGSEVTATATIWDGEARKKLSASTPRLFPKVALIDPELALSLSWEATLGPGLDAYSQCFEAICNRNATPVTTALAQQGLRLVPGALRRLRTDPTAIDARSAMAEAALLSGLAISRTRTALAHSMSYPITAHLGLPHGLACALALPGVLAFNLETDDGRLAELAAQAGLEGPSALVPSLLQFYEELGVADAISAHITDIHALQVFVPDMLTAGRADNNIRPADAADVAGILVHTERWFSAKGRIS
jgi:alcohol dehydrogenase